MRLLIISLLFIMSPILANAEKMDIHAKSLEIYQEQGYAVFLDDVKATQGGMDIFSQKLEIFFSKEKGSASNENDIDKIVAEDKVILKYKKDVVKGDKATYNPISDTVIITGNVIFINNENVLKGEKLVYNVKTGKTKLTSGDTGRIKAQLVPTEGK